MALSVASQCEVRSDVDKRRSRGRGVY